MKLTGAPCTSSTLGLWPAIEGLNRTLVHGRQGKVDEKSTSFRAKRAIKFTSNKGGSKSSLGRAADLHDSHGTTTTRLVNNLYGSYDGTH